ncbi:hypothetical protein [Devosia sp. 2618]|uniref:hypothetical protein n=1 Tax=Devosia sp. 2618 TaxID=3156454 RepID=UPI003399523E
MATDLPDFAIPAHPLADLFPMLGSADADALRVDIAANGLRERIVILDGQILDGRNRYRAAVGAGVLAGELPEDGHDLWVSHYRRFNPAQDGDPLAWVLSKNLHRRHLSEGQRAMIADSLATMTVGRPPKAEDNSANLQNLSRSDAADILHVSERSVASAHVVRERGAPELIESVERGEIAVSAAESATKLSVGEQLRLLRENDPRAFSAAVRSELAKPRDARAVQNSRVLPADDLDYSPTPPWATRSLLELVLPHLGQSVTGKTVREPSCGEGHIAAVLQEARPAAIWATDIFDYSVDGVSPPGWRGTVDYLDADAALEPADWTVMNSPFGNKAEQFVLRALRESNVGVCAFLRLGWLASQGRFNRLFSVTPPTVIAIFAEDVPLHMGRWEPDGATQSDYMWLVWVKGMAPQPPFWVPPGQRSALAKPDDVARFTAHPVVGLVEAGNAASALSAAISVDKATALPIIAAEYTGDNAQALADRLGRPINTIRKWAFEAGVTNQARNVARLQNINAERSS